MNSLQALRLTNSQQVACDCIHAFVMDQSRRVFVLQGYAGTGKTLLIGHIARRLQENNRVVNLLAPTGRAARVITDKTGIPGSTIHRCIYNLDELIEHDDKHSKFKFYFQLRKTAVDETSAVYIVDESSMVSDAESEGEFIRFGSGRVLKDLLEFAGICNADQNAKVIFVGDPAQLPPVNMSTSPALDPDYLKSKHKAAAEVYCLTEVVRHTKHSAILDAATRIRSNLERSQFNELVIQPREGEIEATTAEGVGKLWAAVYRPTEPAIPPPLVCVTHTNDAALRYNLTVRAALFGGSGEQQVRKGDYLMIVANNRLTGLLNGDLAVVLDAEEHADRRRVRIFVDGKEQHVELQFRDVEIAYEQSKTGRTKMRCVILENVLFSDLRDITPEQQKALYVDFKMRYPDLKANTTRFTETLLEDPYFNALRVKFGYAATCHKAQGGEWPSAVVVFEHQRTDREGLRWAYTAITRARQKLFGVNLPNKMPWTGLAAGHCESTLETEKTTTTLAPAMVQPTAHPMVPFLDLFPAEPAFLRHKHKTAIEAWATVGIQVEKVEVVPNKYYVRYKLRKGRAFAKLHMTFSKRAKFTVQMIPEFGADDSLANESRAILQAAPHAGADGGVTAEINFPEDLPVLKRFYDEIVRPRSKQVGIAVISVQHMRYRERYVFGVGSTQATVDFIYNDRGEFTKHEATADKTAKMVVKSILKEISAAE